MSGKDYEEALRMLGPTLRRLRSEKKITQVELGALTHKPQSTIARLESVNVPETTVRMLYEVLSTMEISLTEFFGNVEGKNIPTLPKLPAAQMKRLEVITHKIENLDGESRSWVLKLIEYALERPKKRK